MKHVRVIQGSIVGLEKKEYKTRSVYDLPRFAILRVRGGGFN